MSEVKVIVHGRGRVEGGSVIQDAASVALCAVCKKTQDLVVQLAGTSVCVPCMRSALDVASVARYRLSEGPGIPWGKLTS